MNLYHHDGHSDCRHDQVVATPSHVPVLLREVLIYLAPQANKTYIDATFGAGGYSRAILEAAPQCSVIAIDRDPEAEQRADAFRATYPQRFQFVKGRFGSLSHLCEALAISSVAGVVFDVGVSSPQIDQAERGFSFMRDGPLDMRMDKEGISAADVVNHYPEHALAKILYQFGEERASRRIAHKICERRKTQPLRTTKELADLVRSVVKPSADGLDPVTRTFQALRIYINDELGELERGLSAAHALLEPGGRLVVVTFHSLEDRIVKQFFQHHSKTHLPVSRHLPLSGLRTPSLNILTKKAVRTQADEARRNPRADSARLRAAEKIMQEEQSSWEK
jgi:16S rRNA (cytosine1402-N4)-methyltransferase